MSPVQKCTAGTVGGFEHSADTVTSGNASEADSDQVCTHKHKLKSVCMNVKLAAVLSYCSWHPSVLRLLRGIVFYNHFTLPWLQLCLNKDSCQKIHNLYYLIESNPLGTATYEQRNNLEPKWGIVTRGNKHNLSKIFYHRQRWCLHDFLSSCLSSHVSDIPLMVFLPLDLIPTLLPFPRLYTWHFLTNTSSRGTSPFFGSSLSCFLPPQVYVVQPVYFSTPLCPRCCSPELPCAHLLSSFPLWDDILPFSFSTCSFQ